MKVVLVLADGMRSDAVKDISEAQALMKKSTYTLNARTVTPSITLPCHLSLFLSVDPERHGTTTNIYAPQVRPIDGLCEVLKRNNKKCAFFYNWEEHRDLSRPGSLAYSKFVSGDIEGRVRSTDLLIDDAIRYLNEEEPDFAFVYTDLPDDAGHTHCWMSDEYIEAVKYSWKSIAQLLENIPEEYTVIVTTDHGGHGRSHGTEMPEDMIISVMIKGENFEPDKEFGVEVNIKDIAPTVAALLDVQPAAEWEGKSLL